MKQSFSKQHAFVDGVRSPLAESISPAMWELLFSRDYRYVKNNVSLALCSRGLVVLGDLTELGRKMMSVQWRDAETDAVCCRHCQTVAEYVRTRNFEGGDAKVWVCVNPQCSAFENYFHTQVEAKSSSVVCGIREVQ